MLCEITCCCVILPFVYHASFEMLWPNHFTSLLGWVRSSLHHKELDIGFLCVKIRLLNQLCLPQNVHKMTFKMQTFSTKWGTFSFIASRRWSDLIMNWHQHLWDILESTMELMDANDHWVMKLQVLFFTFSLKSVCKKVNSEHF